MKFSLMKFSLAVLVIVIEIVFFNITEQSLTDLWRMVFQVCFLFNSILTGPAFLYILLNFLETALGVKNEDS